MCLTCPDNKRFTQRRKVYAKAAKKNFAPWFGFFASLRETSCKLVVVTDQYEDVLGAAIIGRVLQLELPQKY
jgi:hypothetical protein